jgi:hypothetical protein
MTLMRWGAGILCRFAGLGWLTVASGWLSARWLTVRGGTARSDMADSMNKVNYGLALLAPESFQLKS